MAGAAAAASDGPIQVQGSTEKADTPHIVELDDYINDGHVDPRSLNPIGEAAPAQGSAVQEFAGTLANITGLEPVQAPSVERYEQIGQTLTFNFSDEGYERLLNVTTLSTTSDIPSSVLASEGDSTNLSTLATGSHMLTAEGTEGIRVSTLSKTGQLTQWESPVTESNPLTHTRQDLIRWAQAADNTAMSVAHTPSFTVLARPSCQLTQSNAPYKHGGWGHIQADAAMLCNQTGRGNFSASLRQYHGLGIWKTKDSRGYTNEQGRNFPVVMRYSCKIVISKWTYRSNIGNASLRNSNGVWGKSNVFSATAGHHCA